MPVTMADNGPLSPDINHRVSQVAGLSEVATDSAEEVIRLLTRGNKERTQEPTAANKTSSRSHALLMVNVTESSSSRAANKRTVRNGR